MDKLSKELKKWRADRPDEWMMDVFIWEAKKLESVTTCSPTERAFLDEIREKFRWIDDTEFGAGIYLGREKSFTSIHQDDFKTSLKELFDEK